MTSIDHDFINIYFNSIYVNSEKRAGVLRGGGPHNKI